ncbi:MAG TPA: ribonuclease III [Dehalococcoidia bacterium]|nr:ribonuclease III [Dehalococcoidia bacterium]
MDNLAAAQQAIGVSFDNPLLLREALVHGSYANEYSNLVTATNERLEFLGDAVLSMVVATKLYTDFPLMDEGKMTKLRAVLVKGNTLARVAREIGLGGYLLLGKGEEATGGRTKPANLAGAMEAVIGAVFLDKDYDTAGDYILKLLDTELQKAVDQGVATSYKSELQELLQAQQQQAPTYNVVEATGPPHDRWFTVEVSIGDTILGRGSGRSKKNAETDAAHAILNNLLANFTE